MVSQEELYHNFTTDFNSRLYQLKTEQPFSDYIFLCVGSDKITGDAYGPLVGEELEKLLKGRYQNIKVIGTLENPVLATNINETIEKIYQNHRNPCVIAIDSALSSQDEIGKIIVSNQKMQCGKGTNKKTRLIGDISVKAIVAKDYKIPRYNFSMLQNTPLGMVLKLAQVTSNGIYDIIKYR